MSDDLRKRYEDAVYLYNSAGTKDTFKFLLDEFTALEGFEDADKYLEKCRQFATWAVGETVTFGCYKGKPIQWIIVDQMGKERLLVAKDVVDRKQLATKYEDVYWATSLMRQWLNHDFMREAFSLAEQTMMIVSVLNNDDNPITFTTAGPDSRDKIFMLSHDEVLKYFPTEEERAIGSWYWLRTPGNTLTTCEVVFENGQLYHLGTNCVSDKVGVRPAVRIRLR